MNLFLHGIEDFRIVRGDTLANPPYSIKQRDRDAWSADPWGRNIYGTPPQGRADYAFWQHIIKSMKAKSGRCAILFPHGVLFRNEESAMREKLVAHDVVECVLGLGPNLFYNSPMEACVVICRMNKPKERRNKVLFINALNEVTRERAQSFLTDDHIQRIVAAYQAFGDKTALPGWSAMASSGRKGGNLSIPLYVRQNRAGVSEASGEYQSGDLRQAIVAWQSSSKELRQSMGDLFGEIERLTK
jgi:type I restriction enzyme M protein